MKSVYLKLYVEDRKLSASLLLLNDFILSNSIGPQAPPFCVQAQPFCVIFIRLADRVLYHSANVWAKYMSDLNIPTNVLEQMPSDALIGTSDLSSKYEIEAYLGGAKALFETNLVGINGLGKQNLLGRSFSADPAILKRLRQTFNQERKKFFRVANLIRNHSYHVNPELRDGGFVSLLKRSKEGLSVTLPNVYVDKKGKSVDLAEVFFVTHQGMASLFRDVRDTLLAFFFKHAGYPSHGSYRPFGSEYGTMSVGLGPKGFEFSDFHEAAKIKRRNVTGSS